MEDTKVYIVLSRDNGFILCTTDKEKAEDKKKSQIYNEEMAGGRPSVYIEETILVR